ncbi:MAG: FAD:protein FMN transferase [Thermoanaerobaculia bacterium]
MTSPLHRLLPPPAALLTVSAFVVALSGVGAAAQSPGTVSAEAPTALRISGPAFGVELEVEVLDLPRPAGEKALNAAWDAVVGAERELGTLIAAARTGRAALSPDLVDLMARASAFCTWSDGASGPTGGAVYRLWDEGSRSGALPTPDRLEEAATTTKCSRLTLDSEIRSLELAAGSELDLRGFARGWAVDLAVRAVVAAGARNLRVALGPVTRGLGPGPGGKGWPVFLPTLSTSGSPGSRVLLLDQAIAVADPGTTAFEVAGERILPAFDLRSGRPATGVSSVAAVTTLAADAEPLALAMSVLGANGGQLRLGSLRPKPSVLWLLGSGATAVVASSNWSAVRKP